VPDPLFILCPGRSFSSVVAAVIGQHPQCYGLPELYIFVGETLGETVDLAAQIGFSSLAGLERTLAELHDGVQTVETVKAAQGWIAANRHLTSRQVMEHIQEHVGDRILVEKSVGLAGGAGTGEGMYRALRAYPKASFLQLLRHPRSRGVSHQTAMEELRFRRFMTKMMGVTLDYEARWTDKHIQIHDLGRKLPPGQFMRINGEIFLRDLRLYLPQVCEWLGIRSDEEAIAAMLRPEDSPYSCIGPDNARGGANRGFLADPKLDLDRLARMKDATLDAPMDWDPERDFSETTKVLASYYGYR
jgi:Sulfotransferase family